MSFEASLKVGAGAYTYYPVSEIEGAAQLPYSLTVLLENVLRCGRTPEEAQAMAERIVTAGLAGQTGEEVEFSPARVLFQDFTGVPVFVDFAVMREACADLGGDPKKINPQVPCDLVIDHSVIADVAGCDGCMDENMKLEFKRNGERYDFLKWAQESFENVRIVPPGQGICHQLNIEKFASVVMESPPALRAPTAPPWFTSTRWWALTPIRPRPTASAYSVGAWAASRRRRPRSASPSRRSCPASLA